VIVLKVTGEALLEALENSVSAYPALEGRFPQLSNIEMEFDPKAPRMKRITWAKVQGEPLDTARMYKLVTRGYMGRGKDGYDALLVKSEGGEAEEIVSEENGVLISTILRQYFMSLKVLGRWKAWGDSMHHSFNKIHDQLHVKHPVHEAKTEEYRRNSVIPMPHKYPHRKDANDTPFDEEEDEAVHGHGMAELGSHDEDEKHMAIMRKVMRKWRRLAGLPQDPALADTMEEGEFMINWTKVGSINSQTVGSREANLFWKAIAPRLEGRIRMCA
jgi:5'-nucleotidase